MEATTQTKPVAIPLPELEHLLVSAIIPDPDQPRKFYDQSEMDDLILSVKESGVIQPILVRPLKVNFQKPVKYMIVVGERRFKASEKLGLATIPAVIQDLNPDEVLKFQITENLHRADVHPLDEAVAFKALLGSKQRKFTVDDVAAKVGKSPYFVRQRIKLNSLSADWQSVFFKGKIHVSTALDISALAPKEQSELYKSKVSPARLKDPHWEPEIDNWDYETLRRKLKKAPFDTTDPTLVPMMGACTACPFNSAVASLFPEDAKDPVCNNASCFSAKCDKAFERNLVKAMEDPEIILVKDHWNVNFRNDDKNNIAKLEKAGHKIYTTEEVVSDHLSFSFKQQKGVVLKAFHVSGSDRGQQYNVKLRGKGGSTSTVTDAKKKEGKLTAADISAEVSRINTREKRNKELDANKVHTEIIKQVEKNKTTIMNFSPMAAADRAIMVYMLLHEVRDANGYNTEKIKIPGLPTSHTFSKGYNQKYFQALGKVTDKQLSQIIRSLVFKKWLYKNLSFEVREHDTATLMIANYSGINTAKITKAQSEKAEARRSRASQRIKSLKESLNKPAKPAEKKEVKKPAAAKK